MGNGFPIGILISPHLSYGLLGTTFAEVSLQQVYCFL
jgi:hypothetical protein